jgi:hypothetical protein
MDRIIEAIVIGVVIVGIVVMTKWVTDNMPSHPMKYDCRLAEISVDYPQAVKEKCRRLSHG